MKITRSKDIQELLDHQDGQLYYAVTLCQLLLEQLFVTRNLTELALFGCADPQELKKEIQERLAKERTKIIKNPELPPMYRRGFYDRAGDLDKILDELVQAHTALK